MPSEELNVTVTLPVDPEPDPATINIEPTLSEAVVSMLHAAPVPAPVTEQVGALPLACTRPSFTSPVAVNVVKFPLFGVVAPMVPFNAPPVDVSVVNVPVFGVVAPIVPFKAPPDELTVPGVVPPIAGGAVSAAVKSEVWRAELTKLVPLPRKKFPEAAAPAIR